MKKVVLNMANVKLLLPLPLEPFSSFSHIFLSIVVKVSTKLVKINETTSWEWDKDVI